MSWELSLILLIKFFSEKKKRKTRKQICHKGLQIEKHKNILIFELSIFLD